MVHSLLLFTSLCLAAAPELKAEEAALLEALEAKAPQLAQELLELRESDPALYEKKLRFMADRHRPTALESRELEEAKRAVVRIEDRMRGLLDAYVAAETEEERTALDAEVRRKAAALDLSQQELSTTRQQLATTEQDLAASRAETESQRVAREELELVAERGLAAALQALHADERGGGG